MIRDRAKARGLSEAEYMSGNLLHAEVTADDVAFSLGRNMDPVIPSFYGAQYANVASIDVTDERTVTVTMTQPDAWFRSTLASSSAWIVQKAFVEAAGPDFGNPTGRTMCSGSYQLGDWSVGAPLVAVRNDAYWDASVQPLVGSIEFLGAPDPIRDEVPVAFVVAADPAAPPTADELAAWCADRLGKPKVPREFTFLDELPRTSVGKIRKFLLKEEATP